MSIQKHLTFVAYSFLTWLTFYLIGLPEYYQQWPFWSKVVLCIAVTAMYFPGTVYTLKKFWSDGKHFTNSLWLALYLTLPLFTYDYLLIGLYWGLGIEFVFSYWYLSLFYFSFWIQFPAVGYWLQRKEV